ncbi:hypothetical protein [Flavobacterium sp. HNIBRBA15423]|uniref:hypothetical protein n=1 Tax=Flavobacterium sp. HNIBRBA15423 TaxID=3458683 RepID=UPI0040449C47
MKNLYNKGTFRGYEYAKHLHPFGKKLGNRKWRATVSTIINEQLSLEQNNIVDIRNPAIRKKRRKTIKVKITYKGYNDTLTSEYRSYKSHKELEDSIKRNKVVRVLFKTKEKDTWSEKII